MSKRQYLTPEQKAAIVREHLIDDTPVADICDKYGTHPTQSYSWQKQLFENAPACFERKKNSFNARRQEDSQQQRIAELEAKIQTKNEVVAELSEEHVKLKEASGGP